MLASDCFGIKRTGQDDWFDTILDVDTELFVDPFLIFKEEGGPWKDGHHKLIAHFNRAFLLIAEANCNPSSLAYGKAVELLFQGAPGMCLGYTAEGTSGLGSGYGFARLIAVAIVQAISADFSIHVTSKSSEFCRRELGPTVF